MLILASCCEVALLTSEVGHFMLWWFPRLGYLRRRYQLEDCSQTVFQTGHCGHCIHSDTLQYWTYLETTFQGRGLRETDNFIDKSTIYTTQIHPQCPHRYEGSLSEIVIKWIHRWQHCQNRKII